VLYVFVDVCLFIRRELRALYIFQCLGEVISVLHLNESSALLFHLLISLHAHSFCCSCSHTPAPDHHPHYHYSYTHFTPAHCLVSITHSRQFSLSSIPLCLPQDHPLDSNLPAHFIIENPIIANELTVHLPSSSPVSVLTSTWCSNNLFLKRV